MTLSLNIISILDHVNPNSLLADLLFFPTVLYLGFSTINKRENKLLMDIFSFNPIRQTNSNDCDRGEWRCREIGSPCSGADPAGTSRWSFAFFGEIKPSVGVTRAVRPWAVWEEAGGTFLTFSLRGIRPLGGEGAYLIGLCMWLVRRVELHSGFYNILRKTTVISVKETAWLSASSGMCACVCLCVCVCVWVRDFLICFSKSFDYEERGGLLLLNT